MRIILFIILIPILTFAQENATTVYEVKPIREKNVFAVQDSIIVPFLQSGNKTEFKIFKIGHSQVIRSFTYDFPGQFSFEDEFVYIHYDNAIIKKNRNSLETIWKTEYDWSQWEAQWEIQIHKKYVSAITFDRILICDKISGKPVLELKQSGNEFGEELSISGEYAIITKDEGEVLAYDLRNGKKVWVYNVGSDTGFGSLTHNGKIFLPSWDPKLHCLNQKTGAKIWSLQLDDLYNGCGSGFEEPPVVFNNKLYAVHRDIGIFIIEENTGKIIQEFDDGFSEIVDNAVLYKDHLIFADTDNLILFNLKTEKVEKKVSLPFKLRSGVQLIGDQILIYENIQWDNTYKTGVITFNLTKILN